MVPSLAEAARKQEPRAHPTREKLLAELSWAKEKYPSLATVRVDSLENQLLAWFKNRDTIPVWVLDETRHCAKSTLARVPPDDYETNPVPKRQWPLALRECAPWEPDESGHPRRVCGHEPVGHTWLITNDNRVETLIHGKYVRAGPLGSSLRWGFAEEELVPPRHVLSKVDTQSAEFAGAPIRILAGCTPRLMACETGGARDCGTCDSLLVWTTSGHVENLPEQLSHRQPATCTEPCPPLVVTEDRLRLGSLNRLPLWELPRQDPAEPPSPVAGIYRDRGLCREQAHFEREYPQFTGFH